LSIPEPLKAEETPGGGRGTGPLLVLGLAGSPRAGGNTDTLLDAALGGAKSAGAMVEKLAIRGLRIGPCLECLACQDEFRCIQEDDAPPTLDRLEAADLVIVAAPVFFQGPPSQLKALIDRAQPLWLRRLPRDHPIRQMRGGYFISAAGSPETDAFACSTRIVRSFLATLRTTWMGELIAPGLNEADEAARNKALISRARSEGRRIVRELTARRRKVRRELLDAECAQIEHAGEMPEVAYHSAIFALADEETGPRLHLSPAEVRLLEKAAFNRYRRIIARDLTFRTRRFDIFRGAARAIVNFARLKDFARRFRFRLAEVRQEASGLLQDYLLQEERSGWLVRSVNCTREELEAFMRELGLNPKVMAGTLAAIFSRPPLTFEETQRLTFFSNTNLYPYRYMARRGGAVEIGVASETEEAPQRIRLDLAGRDQGQVLSRAELILKSIPKPDRP